MENKDQKYITLVVDDEQYLYLPFSPEPEFSNSVKSYIRSKASVDNHRENIHLRVVSQEPLDEERFRTAMSNWGKDEKAVMDVEMKDTMRMLIGTLIFGTIMILLSLMTEARFEVAKYSLMPIIGSLALGKAAEILVFSFPTFGVKKRLITEMGKGTSVTFEYGQEKKLR
jgi:hypothetical protein